MVGSNKLPYFPFHADDWLNDPAVMGMDADAEGCYIRLLARSWKSGTPGVVPRHLVDEMAGLYRITDELAPPVPGLDWCVGSDGPGARRRGVVLDQLSDAFEVQDHVWVQRRMVLEHEKLSRVLASRKLGAKLTNSRQPTLTGPVSAPVSDRSPTEEVEVDLEVEESKSKSKDLSSPVGSVGSYENGKSKTRPLKAKSDFREVELPECIGREDWANWCEYRRSLGTRYPWTSQAAKLSVSELTQFADQGFPAKAVVEQSIMNGWRGLFPLKDKPKTNGSDGWEVTHR